MKPDLCWKAEHCVGVRGHRTGELPQGEVGGGVDLHTVDTGHQEVVPLAQAQTLLAQHHAQLGPRHGRVVSPGAGGRRYHPASRDQGTWAAAVGSRVK